MPPWRTDVDTRSGGSPISLAMMPSASSAAFLCCTSKSGGTYSASMTGVSGKTLIRRMLPFDCAAIISAAAIAGLASVVSARSIGIRMFLYIAAMLSSLAICRRQRTRGDEALEAAAMRMQLSPLVAGKIDDDQPGGGQAFVELLAQLDIARSNQAAGKGMQPGIVPNHHERASRPVHMPDGREDPIGSRIV